MAETIEGHGASVTNALRDLELKVQEAGKEIEAGVEYVHEGLNHFIAKAKVKSDKDVKAEESDLSDPERPAAAESVDPETGK